MTRETRDQIAMRHLANGMCERQAALNWGPDAVMRAKAMLGLARIAEEESEPDVTGRIVPSVYKEHRKRAATKAEAAARKAENRRLRRAKMKAELAALRKAHALRLEGRA